MIFSLRADATEPQGLESERIEIGPLSVAALHRILGDALGRTFARPVLIRIAEASGGNPLHAIEIARELERRGVQDSVAPLPVPDSLGALVRARVRALPSPTRDALLRVAALARPDTRSSTRRLSPRPKRQASCRSIPRDACASRIRCSPRRSTPPQRPRGGERCTRDLAALVVDPIERAHHLALASDGADPGVVAELESAAAARALPRGTGHGGEPRRARAPARAARQRGVEAVAARARGASVLRERLRARTRGARGRAPDAGAGRPTLTSADGARRDRLLAQGRIGGRRLADGGGRVLPTACCSAPGASRSSRCTQARSTSSRRAARRAPRAISSRGTRRTSRGSPRRRSGRGCVRISSSATGSTRRRPSARTRWSWRRPSLPVAVDSRVVFKLGQWLRYVDDLDGARARLDEAEQQARDEGDDASLGNILLNQAHRRDVGRRTGTHATALTTR